MTPAPPVSHVSGLRGWPRRQVSASDERTISLRAETQHPKVGALTRLEQTAKVPTHAINKLSRYGIDTTVPLPKIAVVGDRSAGKSSLIEGISISLISNDNVGGPGHASVSLQKNYDYYLPEQISRRDGAGVKRLFYPWRKRGPPSAIAFGPARSKDEPEKVAQLAQIATLNPGLEKSHIIIVLR